MAVEITFMTRTEKAALRHWQGEPDLHPMTCGNDSSHQVLRALWSGEFGCMDCDYRQEHFLVVAIDFFMTEARAALGIMETTHIPDERPGSLDAPWMEEPDPPSGDIG